ncbi:adenylate kinase [uncultured Cocleimonas sp.]|uniref:adenylate kinase n=1 Tax=uncultured Cocleimonas sp. TaxID=1051587 RepID=UPI0026144C5C|nr:adenylate kinase [uncultured Cocleimonas sp.]
MNILAFGPNGSGKGTQGAIVKDKYGLDHIESGAIFREHIKGGTELGLKAKEYINEGNLVPDEITIPMVLETLAKSKDKGWLLDGFPRSLAQAEALDKALKESGMKLDVVIEIVLDREIAKERIMGRRLCANDNNHPNHIAFEAIRPVEKDGKLVCRVCGGELSARADDQDEDAINKRHNIYYDDNTGTMAAVNYFKTNGNAKIISIDGSKGIKEISEEIISQLP